MPSAIRKPPLCSPMAKGEKENQDGKKSDKLWQRDGLRNPGSRRRRIIIDGLCSSASWTEYFIGHLFRKEGLCSWIENVQMYAAVFSARIGKSLYGTGNSLCTRNQDHRSSSSDHHAFYVSAPARATLMSINSPPTPYPHLEFQKTNASGNNVPR